MDILHLLALFLTGGTFLSGVANVGGSGAWSAEGLIAPGLAANAAFGGVVCMGVGSVMAALVCADALALQLPDAGYAALIGGTLGMAAGIWVLAWSITRYRGDRYAPYAVLAALGAVDIAFAAAMVAAVLL